MADRVLATIDAARRRLLWIGVLRVSGTLLCLLGLSLCLLLFGHRCLGDYPLSRVAAAAAAAFLLLGVWRGWRERPSRALAVLTLDERFALQERLASAYGIARPRDAVEQAVVEDAEQATLGIDLARGLPVRLPLGWKLLPLVLALLGLLWWQLPAADLLGLRAAAAARRAEVVRVGELADALRNLSQHEQSVRLQPRLVHALAALADSLDAERPAWRASLRRINGVFDQHERDLEGALPYPVFFERYSASGGRRIDRVRDAFRQRDFTAAAQAMDALAAELQGPAGPSLPLARACDSFAQEIGQVELLRHALQQAALEMQREAPGKDAAAWLVRGAAELRLLAARDEALLALSALREGLRHSADGL